MGEVASVGKETGGAFKAYRRRNSKCNKTGDRRESKHFFRYSLKVLYKTKINRSVITITSVYFPHEITNAGCIKYIFLFNIDVNIKVRIVKKILANLLCI